MKVLVFAASLRKESLNDKLPQAATRVARQFGATVDLASMRDFSASPHDGDLEVHAIPAGAHALRD